jgi:hypothetical protein
MSAATALLAELRGQGFVITPKGDALRVAPATHLTPELRELIRRHKPGLLALVRGSFGNCAECGRALDGRRRCLRCHYRVCPGGRPTGSAFIELCLVCDLAVG